MNRRGFLFGLGALVAAPAVIRVAELMPISTRFTPAYVPINWLRDWADWGDNEVCLPRDPKVDVLLQRYGMKPVPLDLKAHAWPRPLGSFWVNLNDYDPGFVRESLRLLDLDELSLDDPRRYPEKLFDERV